MKEEHSHIYKKIQLNQSWADIVTFSLSASSLSFTEALMFSWASTMENRLATAPPFTFIPSNKTRFQQKFDHFQRYTFGKNYQINSVGKNIWDLQFSAFRPYILDRFISRFTRFAIFDISKNSFHKACIYQNVLVANVGENKANIISSFGFGLIGGTCEAITILPFKAYTLRIQLGYGKESHATAWNKVFSNPKKYYSRGFTSLWLCYGVGSSILFGSKNIGLRLIGNPSEENITACESFFFWFIFCFSYHYHDPSFRSVCSVQFRKKIKRI